MLCVRSANLAEEANGAVVMLRHLTRAAADRSLLRGGGSVGITAMARSQLKVCRHPDDPKPAGVDPGQVEPGAARSVLALRGGGRRDNNPSVWSGTASVT